MRKSVNGIKQKKEDRNQPSTIINHHKVRIHATLYRFGDFYKCMLYKLYLQLIFVV